MICTFEENNCMLSHLDAHGNPTMVNVSSKELSFRTATAAAKVIFTEPIFAVLNGHQFHTSKGSVIAAAIIAGTMAAKQTAAIIPFCHSIPLESCKLEMIVLPDEHALRIEAAVSTHGKTGVEMEALVAVSAAALCVYDMCKALSHEIIISEIRLLSKTGGKSDFHHE
jgi:cyclic pyranopterin phosphate synthase